MILKFFSEYNWKIKVPKWNDFFKKYSNVHCCFFSVLVLTCYRLMKGRATFYRPETIVASLFLLMVLSFKVILNHTSKHQFVVLYFRIYYSKRRKRNVQIWFGQCKENFSKEFMIVASFFENGKLKIRRVE